jgi:predicted phage terminase large subunit-like protein
MPQDPGQAGVAQMEFYSRELDGYRVEFSSESGEKVTRAEPFAVQVNNRNVEMLIGDWNAAYREELRSFPNGKHDDQVDASSRAHTVLSASSGGIRISDEALGR